MCRFLDCLSEVALEYARRSHISKYDELRKYMQRRFNKKEASAARRQLQYIRQTDIETIEEFAERVHFLTMDGYYRRVLSEWLQHHRPDRNWSFPSWLSGKPIYSARKSYSSKPQLYAQRQVTFSDGNESDQSL